MSLSEEQSQLLAELDTENSRGGGGMVTSFKLNCFQCSQLFSSIDTGCQCDANGSSSDLILKNVEDKYFRLCAA